VGTDSSPVASQRNQKEKNTIVKNQKFFHVRRYIGLLPLIM
jgi:hypothetical protein